MSTNVSPQSTAVGRWVAKACDYAVHYGVEIFLISLILYFCVSRGVTFSVDVYDPVQPAAAPLSEAVAPAATAAPAATLTASTSEANLGTSWYGNVTASATALLASFSDLLTTKEEAAIVDLDETARETTVAIDAKHKGFNEVARTDDPAPHISNLTLVLSPDYGKRKNLPEHIITAKKGRVQAYLDRYAPLARREMADYGIPASITLAQGLLESNAGDSKLAVNSNNHFGIKCRKKCLGCTCRNYGDDTRYDMFRVFGSVAESFREHSELLNSKRYAKLKGHGNDYKKWAHGLKACGYATDKNYGTKLIKIIENLGLARYDQVV